MENVKTFYPSRADVFLYPGFENNPFINLCECIYAFRLKILLKILWEWHHFIGPEDFLQALFLHS